MRLVKPKGIDRDEVLRYLCYNRESNFLTEEMGLLVDGCMAEVLDVCVPRAAISDVLGFVSRDDGVYLVNTNLVFSGVDIRRHLMDCNGVVLFGVSLGQELDRFLAALELRDVTRYVIADACGNALVEQMVDVAQDILFEGVRGAGLFMTSRYSPGYGDFDVLGNIGIVDVLDGARVAGIFATRTGFLMPKKSTTALVGVSDVPVTGHLAGCETCALRASCELKRGGKCCGV